jgi:hypothetical protein
MEVARSEMMTEIDKATEWYSYEKAYASFKVTVTEALALALTNQVATEI